MIDATQSSHGEQQRCVDLRTRHTLRGAFPALVDDDSRVSVCRHVYAGDAVAVGLSCGALLVLSLREHGVVLCEAVAQARVLDVVYQALADDTLAFLWVATGGRVQRDDDEDEEDDAASANARDERVQLTMFQLSFASIGDEQSEHTNDGEDEDDDDVAANDGFVRRQLEQPRSVTRRYTRHLPDSTRLLIAKALCCEPPAAPSLDQVSSHFIRLFFFLLICCGVDVVCVANRAILGGSSVYIAGYVALQRH